MADGQGRGGHGKKNGATGGVAGVGARYGVEGNLGFSLMGAIAGEGAGVLTVSTLAGVGLGDPLGGAAYVLGVPLVSAVGAALGYNVDAKLTGAAPAP